MATGGVALGVQTGFQAVDEERQTEANTLRTEQLTKLAAAQTSEAQLKTDREQRLMAFAQTPLPPPPGDAPPASPESLVAQVQARAQQLLGAGFDKEGADLGEKAAQMSSHAATIRNQQFAQKMKALDEQSKAIEQMDGLLAPVKDQTSLNAVVLSWRAQHPDDPIPEQFLTYDPVMFDSLRQGTKQGREFLKEQMNELRQTNLQADREDRQRDRVFKETQEERRTRVQEDREDRIVKNAGVKAPKAGEPSKQGVALATSVVRDGFPDMPADVIMGKDATTQGAMAVASDAKVRMANNPALSLSEATNQAFIAAKDRGDFKHVEGSGGFLGIGGTKTKDVYSPSSTPKPPAGAAEPLPADRTSLVSGKVYQTARGPAKWNGSSFTPVQ